MQMMANYMKGLISF